MTRFILLIACLLLPACGTDTVIIQKNVYNFADSVLLIRELIKSDSLPQILQEADPEAFERLINNFSPAQMALESEVLNCTLPVLLYFYIEQPCHLQLLEQVANEHKDKIKILIIDADAFFSIAEQFEIESYPAIIGMDKRDEIYREVNVGNEKIISGMNKILSNY